MLLFSQVKVLRSLQQPLLLLSLLLVVLQPCNAAFDPSFVSGSVTPGPDGSGNYWIEYSIYLGDETKGKDVEDIVLFTVDDQDQIHATTTNMDLKQSMTSIVQYSVLFEPKKFLLMGATPGTVGGIEPDKPHVVIISTSSFQADVAGYLFSQIFLQGEQGFTIPNLRDPTATNLDALVNMLANPNLLYNPFYDDSFAGIKILHFSCTVPDCSPRDGGDGCPDGTPCCGNDDCFSQDCTGTCLASPSSEPTTAPTPAPPTQSRGKKSVVKFSGSSTKAGGKKKRT
jgi:hypothetical protein